MSQHDSEEVSRTEMDTAVSPPRPHEQGSPPLQPQETGQPADAVAPQNDLQPPQPQAMEQAHSADTIHNAEEMVFQKRTIPKPRTQSVQSVLSSVSLKSFVKPPPSQVTQPPQQQVHQQQQGQGQPQANMEPQLINTKAHIQAPATAASSKRRASFEIGQRLPFHKDEGSEEDAVESDGDVDTTQEVQNKLTDDALKRLSSFSKFTPAKVDITMSTKSDEEADQARLAEAEKNKIDTTIPFRSISNSSQVNPMHLKRPSSAQSNRILQRNMSNLSPVAQSDMEDDHSSIHKALPSHIASNSDLHSTSMAPTPSTTGSIDNTNLKTINDPKRPMYLPAVLRQSNTNLKPEDVQHINEQNSKKSKGILQEAAQSIRSQSSHWSLRFDSSTNRSPTRAHWRRDVSRLSCAICDKNFTFFERRHHCRRCGDIFCAEHTSHLLKLGLDAQFTLGGKGLLCKVCDNCCKDYEAFVKRELGDVAVNGMKRLSTNSKNDKTKQGAEQTSSTVAGSVPADWSWSSF